MAALRSRRVKDVVRQLVARGVPDLDKVDKNDKRKGD